MKKFLLFIALAAAFVIVGAGCAGDQKRQDETVPPEELVWPRPPETPRIKFVAQYAHRFDLEERSRLLTFIGEESFQSLQRPSGVVADRKGNIYVSDIKLLKLVMFDLENRKFRVLDRLGGRKVSLPTGLAMDYKNNLLFYVELSTKEVIAYHPDTDEIKFVIGQAAGTFGRPATVAVDPDRERVYVGDTKWQEVKAFDYRARHLFTLGKGKRSDEDDGFNVPSQLAVGPDGNLYVADMFNRYIKIFDPDGKFVKKLGYGVGMGIGNFSKVTGVALDSEGHVYALDTDFCNFQIFDQDNRVLLFVGGPGRKPGRFFTPKHIVIDPQDRIYVTDTMNLRIQVFQYLRQPDKGEEPPAEQVPSSGGQ